jgi:hypothetical protein
VSGLHIHWGLTRANHEQNRHAAFPCIWVLRKHHCPTKGKLIFGAFASVPYGFLKIWRARLIDNCHDRTRTCNPLINSQVLYRLSYMAIIVALSSHELQRWWVDCDRQRVKKQPLPDLAGGLLCLLTNQLWQALSLPNPVKVIFNITNLTTCQICLHHTAVKEPVKMGINF